MAKRIRKHTSGANGTERAVRSELEGFALGLIWRHGPCSAYGLRKLMTDSPSTQWSGSAGAVYPLVERLAERGLVKSSADAGDGRGRRSYTITARGEGALRAWIGPPLAGEAVTVSYDPLRSRARFLGALPPVARKRWVAEAERSLNVVQSRVRAWQEAYGAQGLKRGNGGEADPIAAMITRNGELDVAWRRAWLKELGRVIERSGGGRAGVDAGSGPDLRTRGAPR